MAVLPLAVSAALGLTSSALGAYDRFKAGQQQAEADKAATKFGKELEKIAEQQQIVDMPLPSRGAELERQAAEQAMATGVAAAQVAGPEGVIGLVPQLEQQRRKQDLQTAARLERLEFDRNRAAERMRREGVSMMAGLQSQRLAGAGMARAEAERRRLAGMQSIVGGLGQAAELYLESQPLYDDATTARKQARAERKADKRDLTPMSMATTGFQPMEALTPVRPMQGEYVGSGPLTQQQFLNQPQSPYMPPYSAPPLSPQPIQPMGFTDYFYTPGVGMPITPRNTF